METLNGCISKTAGARKLKLCAHILGTHIYSMPILVLPLSESRAEMMFKVPHRLHWGSKGQMTVIFKTESILHFWQRN